MGDTEKPLKIVSVLVSVLLIISALVFFLLASRAPKVAEAALEYTATPGLDPVELTATLQQLRLDQALLTEVAIRSEFASASDPDLARLTAKLGSRRLVVSPGP